MENGYYLATYLAGDKLDNLLHISLKRHDQAVALFYKENNDIRLIKYWEIERFSGQKEQYISFFDKEHLYSVLEELLSTINLTLQDIQEIWGTPEISTTDDYHSLDDFPELTYHSISHLFSSVLLDSRKFYEEKIIGLAVDSAPDIVVDKHAKLKDFYTGCFIDKGKISIFPIYSPGWLWDWAAEKFKMKPGTLMALANASLSKSTMKTPDVLELKNREINSKVISFIDELVEILDYSKDDIQSKFNYYDQRFTEQENKISMIMKIIQEMSQKIMDYNITSISVKFNVDPSEAYLSLSGGFALNCPTNTYLMNKYKFKGFMCPPCTNDSGLALGIGLYSFYKNTKDKINFKFDTPFFGHTDDTLFEVINSNDYQSFIKDVRASSPEVIVKDIRDFPVVWFNGPAEVGPRALGNRSILADPTNSKSKELLNQIKQREWWRPVAPIVLEDDLQDWFENSFESKYMLHTFKINQEKSQLVPAICHLDNTARIQSIDEQINKEVYDIIKKFKEITGVPMICNTSLNDKGEPIINTIPEALNFALRKKIPVIYINGYRITLQNHSKYSHKEPLNRLINIDLFNDNQKQELIKKINPYDIPINLLKYYNILLEQYPDKNFDLTDKKVANRVKREISIIEKLHEDQLCFILYNK